MSRIALIGPESVGKSTLAKQLGKIYNMPVVAEYARDYVANLNRPYTYDDVELIAKHQTEEYEQYEHAIFDTEMIITKVWFDVAYCKRPIWLDKWMRENRMDYYLLLKPDIEWQADPTRENGDKREWLFNIYRKELEALGAKYDIVSGSGEARLNHALNFLKEIF